MARSYVFKGSKDYQPSQIQQALGLLGTHRYKLPLPPFS